MFFDDVPPDTSVYMIAGYVIFFVVTAIYVASLFIRTRNLSRDLETLNEAEQEQRAPVTKAPAPPRATPRSRAAKARSSSARPTRKKQGSRKTR